MPRSHPVQISSPRRLRVPVHALNRESTEPGAYACDCTLMSPSSMTETASHAACAWIPGSRRVIIIIRWEVPFRQIHCEQVEDMSGPSSTLQPSSPWLPAVPLIPARYWYKIWQRLLHLRRPRSAMQPWQHQMLGLVRAGCRCLARQKRGTTCAGT